jgi:acetyl-CoA acetyltransferase
LTVVPSLLNQAAIAGIGQTEFSKNSGRSELQLAAEASRAAIVDAGLTPADIDGLVTFTLDNNDERAMMTTLGIPEVRFLSRTPYGGAGASSTVQHAAMAVVSGMCRAVLVYRAFNERSGHRFGQPQGAVTRPMQNWRVPFSLDTPAKIYSMSYQRYMAMYGVTNEDFGRYTVVARKHASTNPNAWFYERPITLEDHQRSRWIVEPVLRLLDCCQESDGGVAMVVTTAERARDLAQPGVRIEALNHNDVRAVDIIPNYFPQAPAQEDEALARLLWNESGFTPQDIDVAMIYENFSPIVLMLLEAYGFCGPGEAKDFIAEGNIGLDGSLPVNTNGGLLGEAYIHGLNNVLEGVRQVRGTAANQIDGVEHVLVAAGTNGMVLGRV